MGRGPERGQWQGMPKKPPRPRPLSGVGRGKGSGGCVFRGPVRPVTNSNWDEESTRSAADYSEPKPPTPEPAEAEMTIPTHKTPQRTQTSGGFPMDTPKETIQIRPPQDINPPLQDPIYSQRPRTANASKFTATRFHHETFSSLATYYPNPNTYNCQGYNTMSTTKPTTYAEAIKRQNNREWKEAIEEELTSLRDNNTWMITSLPEGQTTVRCKWVFKEK